MSLRREIRGVRFREWGPRLRLLLKLHGERRVALDEREPRREVQAPALRLRVLARLGVRQRALQHLRDARGLHATRAAGAPPPRFRGAGGGAGPHRFGLRQVARIEEKVGLTHPHLVRLQRAQNLRGGKGLTGYARRAAQATPPPRFRGTGGAPVAPGTHFVNRCGFWSRPDLQACERGSACHLDHF